MFYEVNIQAVESWAFVEQRPWGAVVRGLFKRKVVGVQNELLDLQGVVFLDLVQEVLAVIVTILFWV